jgi:O-methyltransferase involved in polyketide biosynthesis
MGAEAISPTAHYTGYVWARNGLSHRALSTIEGRLLYESLRPVMTLSAVLGRGTLEGYLLARHRAIDALLERAIDRDGVTQVIELACGLSPRGWRFTRRYGDRLTYIEADLPDMAARKRQALAQMGSLGDRHRVCDVDALQDDGQGSLTNLAAELDRRSGLAIITEGLLGYLPADSVAELWQRLAAILSEFAGGRYTSDLHLGGAQTREVRAFRVMLSMFVRGRVYLHFQNAEQAAAALQAAGFDAARVLPASSLAGETNDPAGRLAHIIEASTT